mgnify:CR=1 FL=1
MNYALKLDNVCKTYETSDFLLDNVSFEVPMGSVMGFVGENGAGKTTTIGCSAILVPFKSLRKK